jgi:hypothetical protein
LIPEYHKISIGILTQAVIVVITRHTFHSHQTIEFVPELVLIYMGKGVNFFPFNRRRIASNTKDFILFFVNKVRKDSLVQEIYLAIKNK